MTRIRTTPARDRRKVVRPIAAIAALAVTVLLLQAPAVDAGQLNTGSAGATTALKDIGTSFNGKLLPNQYIQSSNDRYRLIMQSDGNLVLYDRNQSRACWGSGTDGIRDVWAEYHEGALNPAVPYLDLNSPYGHLKRYKGGYTWLNKTGNVNVNNSGEVWIAYKKFVSC